MMTVRSSVHIVYSLPPQTSPAGCRIMVGWRESNPRDRRHLIYSQARLPITGKSPMEESEGVEPPRL